MEKILKEFFRLLVVALTGDSSLRIFGKYLESSVFKFASDIRMNTKILNEIWSALILKNL